MKKTALVACLVAIVLVSGACTHRLIDFTIISSKTIDLSRMNEFERGRDRMSGKDSAHMILFIPLGTPNMKEACDRAIESIPGAVALVDGVVTAKSYWFLLYGKSTYIVEGTPLIDPTLASAELESNYVVAYYRPETDDTTLIYTDEENYTRIKEAVDRGDSRVVEQFLNP